MKKTPTKSALAFIAGDERTYSERSAAMTADERQAVQQETAKHFDTLQAIVGLEKQLAGQMELIPVNGVNAAREIGRQIELYTQKSKLQLSQFNSLAVALPDAPFNFAKECLATFRKFPDAVKTADEAADSWKRIKVQLELLPKAGHGKQVSHPDEPIKDFIGKFIRAKSEVVFICKTTPLSQWPDFFRDQFEREGQIVHDMVDEAKAIRLSKDGN